MVTKNVWTNEEIKSLILRNDIFVKKSLIQLYHRQTVEEIWSRQTKHSNGAGFSKFDASFGMEKAEKIINGQELTDRELHFCRQMLIKYANQLAKIANGRN